MISCIFSAAARRQDALRAQYITESSSFKKGVAGAKIIGLSVTTSLIGVFIPASHIASSRDLAGHQALITRHALIEARAASPLHVFARLWAQKRAIQRWEQARMKNDFMHAAPALQQLVEAIRIESQNKARDMALAEPYDALLQSRTAGLSTSFIDSLIEELSFSAKITGEQAKQRQPFENPDERFDMAVKPQKELQMKILQWLGVDMGNATVKKTPHPICLGSYKDTWIGLTQDKDFTTSMLTAAHEAGHALYRQNLPVVHKDSLKGQVAGIAADEAMALLMENHVMRSKSFAGFMAERLKAEFNAASWLTGEKLHRHMTRIADTPIRATADEIRYPLDVILRYKIERALINGDIEVDAIPQIWREEYKKLTGIEPAHDNEAALQDIHWFGGEFGWFPNYLVGQLAAAQIFEAAEQQIPALHDHLANGNLRPLRDWLTQNIYEHGNTKTIFDIVQDITGRTLGPISYRRHISSRYIM